MNFNLARHVIVENKQFSWHAKSPEKSNWRWTSWCAVFTCRASTCMVVGDVEFECVCSYTLSCLYFNNRHSSKWQLEIKLKAYLVHLRAFRSFLQRETTCETTFQNCICSETKKFENKYYPLKSDFYRAERQKREKSPFANTPISNKKPTTSTSLVTLVQTLRLSVTGVFLVYATPRGTTELRGITI